MASSYPRPVSVSYSCLEDCYCKHVIRHVTAARELEELGGGELAAQKRLGLCA